MAQFRKDPFGPTWVIISPERGLEASDFGSARQRSTSCALCPGHEDGLESEVRALRLSSSSLNAPDWQARIVPAQARLLGAKPFEVAGPPFFSHAPASGYQEIVIEHADHRLSLEAMDRAHLIKLFKLYRDRLAHLAGQNDIKHVQLTRSVGAAAGAAFDHPHGQLMALPVQSRWLAEERAAAETYYEQEENCLFCAVMQAELAAKVRVVSHNEAFVALAPYAAKTPFETWLLPRQHSSSFSTLSSNTLPLFVDLLSAVLRAMNTALDTPPYNMLLHTLPICGDKRYHWNMKILPRLTNQAGFDWGSGFYINPTAPEDAVRFLREALALQGVSI